MAVRATLSRFPIDPDAHEGSGLSWGVTVTPFAAKDENGQPPAYGSDGHLLPRCENCWAYFNTYCVLDQWSWTCALCGTLNGLSSKAIARYSRPQSCPEMMSSFIDLELPGKLFSLFGCRRSFGKRKRQISKNYKVLVNFSIWCLRNAVELY